MCATSWNINPVLARSTIFQFVSEFDLYTKICTAKRRIHMKQHLSKINGCASEQTCIAHFSSTAFFIYNIFYIIPEIPSSTCMYLHIARQCITILHFCCVDFVSANVFRKMDIEKNMFSSQTLFLTFHKLIAQP